jgi:type VI secretion system protein ImpE
MTRARELYREGRLGEAIGSLQTYLRDRPSDTAARVFLFELLCFAGDFARAGRQLYALSSNDGEHKNLVALYGAALEAETARQESAPAAESVPAAVGGTLNGRPFTRLADADEILGARLEFIAAGEFHRVPFAFISRIEIAPPARLRDLYFLPAAVQTGPELKSFAFEQVLLPCLYPGSFRFDDDLIKLGRTTEWFRAETGAVRPAGLRLWVTQSDGGDGEEIPLTDVRLVEFTPVGTR